VIGESIRVTGTVQGVGFRPAVWRLASECGVVGQVWNDAEGVLIHAWGSSSALQDFVSRLEVEQPPLSRIEKIIRTPVGGNESPPEDFQIVVSQEGEVRTAVSADACTCPDCLSEVLDPSNRRYRYPFTNCTHCGPRLSIVSAVPYDRANTSMACFDMCEQCRLEYENPTDRRFHAQPNACADCGPQLWLEDNSGNRLAEVEGKDYVQRTAELIQAGKIVAIKGIGGIHLACDAGNDSAVNTLRQRKQRYHKALAMMALDIEMIMSYADVGEHEAAMLQYRAAPIVVLQGTGEPLASGIAPGQNTLGFMLPYTPLHHLLMLELERPMVLTSGNRSEEPQSIDNLDAHRRLDEIADYYLLHDRAIVNRLDDSVLRLADGRPRLLRRGRGYAPQTILLPDGFAGGQNILAMGGELKSTFCLLQDGRATVSQHLGDLEDVATYHDYQHNLKLYRRLFDFDPQLIVVDRHPNYLSSQLGRSMAAEDSVSLVEVQHHHAHIAACMVEHGLPSDTGKVIGVALDGLGYGEDNTVWGGEFLLADYAGYKRVAHFQPAPMLGGAQAMHEPWRNTFAHLMACMGWDRICDDYVDLEVVEYLKGKPVSNLITMAEKGINSPMASSAGRLFDAVAAVLGVCRDSVGYEGQAAIELEALAWRQFKQQSDCAYGFKLEAGCLSWSPLWKSLLGDLRDGVDPAIIAARFHHGLASAVAHTAAGLCGQNNIQTVVLSGGVFQNRLLLERVSQLLRQQNLTVLAPQILPANDGAVSLGQVVVAMMVGK